MVILANRQSNDGDDPGGFSRLTIILAVVFLVLFSLSMLRVSGSLRFGHATLERYDRVSIGMKYEQVKDIMQEDGDVYMSYGNARTYHWYCFITDGYASITFEENVVTYKSQWGLK